MTEPGASANDAGRSDRSGRRNRRPYSRADHRARAHETAHAEQEGTDGDHNPAPAKEHPLVARGAAGLIGTQEALGELIDHLRASGSFAYDSEFIGELTYHPKLCLIQVASSQRVALIDPLAGLDLRPFWELLADPAVEKIVHAGQQDVEPVVRHLDRPAANVFDTQIAAGFVALPYPVSLSKLVQELTGVRLGKGLTLTHWDQRPLSSLQLRYAADDVRYLPLVRAEIGARLEALGHTAWARQECDAQCDPALYRFDARTQYLRVRGAGSLQPRNLAVLRELTVWRDGAARAENLPPRAFLKDEILTDLARSPVKTPDKFDRVRGLPRPVEREHGAAIIAATQRALGLPAGDLPEARSDSELGPTERFRSDALWAAAQALCAGQQVDPALVASRQDLGEFYRAATRGEDLSALRCMRGWRKAVLGEPLLRLMGGSLRAAMRWENDLLVTSLGAVSGGDGA